MAVDYFDIARRLEIIDVFRPGNRTGYVTPRVLFDPTVRAPDGKVKAPSWISAKHWMDHGTVGSNTLPYFAARPGEQAGTEKDGRYVCAQYLVPKDTTMFADGVAHDTSLVVFKMVPDGHGCAHTGDCIGWDGHPVHNSNTVGAEYENLQNGGLDRFTEWQYIKGALIYANGSASLDVPDFRRIPHGLVATPFGRRTDPWAGRFDIARSWLHVWNIREDPRIWQLWGLPQPRTT